MKNPIKKLINRYEQRRKERQIATDRERPFKDRAEVIFSAPRRTVTDFWCKTCGKDCTGTGFRQVSTIRDRLPTAWFVGYCPIGHKVIRRISDKDTDPYYDLSFMIKRMRYDLRDALLTPDNPRFKLLYPKQWEALYGEKKGTKN